MRQHLRNMTLGGLPSIPSLFEGLRLVPRFREPVHRPSSLPRHPAFSSRVVRKATIAVTPHAKLTELAQSTPNQYAMAFCKAHSRHGCNLDGWLHGRRPSPRWLSHICALPWACNLSIILKRPRLRSEHSTGASLTLLSAPSCTSLPHYRPWPLSSLFPVQSKL